MPPVMDERQEINEVIEENEELAHFSESNFVFTDISTSENDRVRTNFLYCFFVFKCAVPENIHISPIKGNGIFQGLGRWGSL